MPSRRLASDAERVHARAHRRASAAEACHGARRPPDHSVGRRRRQTGVDGDQSAHRRSPRQALREVVVAGRDGLHGRRAQDERGQVRQESIARAVQGCSTGDGFGICNLFVALHVWMGLPSDVTSRYRPCPSPSLRLRLYLAWRLAPHKLCAMRGTHAGHEPRAPARRLHALFGDVTVALWTQARLLYQLANSAPMRWGLSSCR